jgi:DNA-binding NarL/FixJ family response regulator
VIGSGKLTEVKFLGVEMRHVLIVEDHPLVAEATRELLNRTAVDLDITLAIDATQARQQAQDPSKDWYRIFLDLDVPGAVGLSLAREFHALGMQGRCCIITALERPEVIAEAYSLGFQGYIVKATPYEEFIAALRDALEGSYVFPRVTSEIPNRIRLTRRQAQILQLVSLGKNSRDIGLDLHLSEGTINNQITATMKALKVSSRSHAVAKAIELGLINMGESNTLTGPPAAGDTGST